MLLQEIRVDFNGGYDSTYLTREDGTYFVHGITRWDTGNFHKSGKVQHVTLTGAFEDARLVAAHVAHVCGGAREPRTVFLLTPFLAMLVREAT